MPRVMSRSAFTLIELMVVVSVIAISAALVTPSFRMTLQRNRQREAAGFITQAVVNARSQAAATGRCHRVTIHLSTAQRMGGFGGAAVVQSSRQAGRCSQGGANWDNVSVHCVGCASAHSILGIPRVSLVGDDVGIDFVEFHNGLGAVFANQNPGDQVEFAFEPTGEMSPLYLIPGPTPPFFGSYAVFRINAYSNTGVIGASRFVTVTAGGAVRYGENL